MVVFNIFYITSLSLTVEFSKFIILLWYIFRPFFIKVFILIMKLQVERGENKILMKIDKEGYQI